MTHTNGDSIGPSTCRADESSESQTVAAPRGTKGNCTSDSECHVDAPRFAGSKYRTIVVVALTGIAFALLGKLLNDNRETLASICEGRISWTLLLLALLCLLGNQLLCIGRWSLLIRTLGVKLSFRRCFDLAVASDLANVVGLGANGGDVVKLSALMTQPGTGIQMLASIVMDRVAGLLGLLCVGSLAGTLALASGGEAVRQVTLITVMCLFALLAGLLSLIAASRQKIVRSACRRCEPLDRILAKGDQVLNAYERQPSIIGLAMLLSVVSQLLTLTALYIIGAALTPLHHADWVTTLIAGPLVFLSAVLPLPFGALGVTEQFSEGLFKSLGHTGGGMTTLVFRCVQFVEALSVGLSWLIIRHQLNGFFRSSSDVKSSS